ncbi:MAG: calcium/sodium antiporter [Alphaproteobacteria bacterium]|nr:calcium/sodium antiporter [Alphaproteobacteria bacterium]
MSQIPWDAVFVAAASLVVLTVSADRLVAAAIRLGALLKLPTTAVALTVVAAGTSLPELVVSLRAAVDGSADLAAANVIGSNIVNVGLILGLSAVIRVQPVLSATLRRDAPLMVAAAVATVALGWNGVLGRIEGVILLAAGLPWLYRLSRAEPDDELASGGGGWVVTLVTLAMAVLGLAIGAQYFLGGALTIARAAGMSERVIGLTLVSLGTSLPELATSVAASLRGRTDVAVGNVVGSNIFNVLGILGLTAVVEPLPVSLGLLRGDGLWMLGLSVGLVFMMWTGRRLVRAEGAVLLVATAAWVATLVAAPGG